MINWAYFPQSDKHTDLSESVVKVFEYHSNKIDSSSNDLKSNEVLAIVAESLEKLEFQVERGKKKEQKICVPVLFGRNGVIEKSFEADAFHEQGKFVLEVEAGRGVLNNQFLKDLFQACMMQDVEYLGIAVRNVYKKSNDFEKIYTFFDTLYKSSRLSLPLKGVLILGY